MDIKLTMLGGASEVGASSTLIEIEGVKILVDCGIRMGSGIPGMNREDKIPDISILDDISIDAILITHAHLDHTGALPLIHEKYPDVPVYMTKPTEELTSVLLADALRIMEDKLEWELEIPLYDGTIVNSLFTKVYSIDYGDPLKIKGVDIRFYPGGHILGASLISLGTKNVRILITGDISITDQRTVGGMTLPEGSTDLLITESTYGERKHSSRLSEERRLVTAVSHVIERGGKVLIPVFALGRAQEVILILEWAQRKGVLPKVPIWIDGMVKRICETYMSHPEYLVPPLRKRVERGENPFFPRGGSTRKVVSGDSRKRIIEGRPCIIVSSSGMLTGGPSQYYAKSLARDELNAIFLTGYQDEESPGRHLVDIAEKRGGGELRVGDEVVDVACEVGMYGLSAHADVDQIKFMVERSLPSNVLLVHGDDQSRAGLAKTLPVEKVYIPNNGDELKITTGDNSKARDPIIELLKEIGFNIKDAGNIREVGLGKGKKMDVAGLGKIWQIFYENCKGRLFTAAELGELYYGESVDEGQIYFTKEVLTSINPYFSQDKTRPFLFKLKPSGQVRLDEKRSNIMAEGDKLIDKLILVETIEGIIPAVCYSVTNMGFHAWSVGKPDTYHDAEAFLEIIDEWPGAHNSDTGEIKQELNSFLCQASIYLRRLAPVSMYKKLKSEASFGLINACEVLSEEKTFGTGLKLGVGLFLQLYDELFKSWVERLDRVRYATICKDPINIEKKNITPELYDGKFEQNMALVAVETFFPPETGLYRKGIMREKGEITLYFHFPDIARTKYAKELDELEDITGWDVVVNTRPNQDALVKEAIKVLSGVFRPMKRPSVHIHEKKIDIKGEQLGKDAELQRVVEEFQEKTGFSFHLSDMRGKAIVSESAKKETPGVYVPSGKSEKREVNDAYWLIKEHFKAFDTPVKVGQKTDSNIGEYIQISLITREKGLEHDKYLDVLSDELGWTLVINPNPDQNAIREWIWSKLPQGWMLVKEPSIYSDKAMVEIKVEPIGSNQQNSFNGLKQEFNSFCSWSLKIVSI